MEHNTCVFEPSNTYSVQPATLSSESIKLHHHDKSVNILQVLDLSAAGSRDYHITSAT